MRQAYFLGVPLTEEETKHLYLAGQEDKIEYLDDGVEE